MPLFKRNPFGHYLFIKKWIIRFFGVISHSRYRNFNNLQIEGSQISWAKDTTTGAITLTIVEEDGSTTTIEIPGSGNFNF